MHKGKEMYLVNIDLVIILLAWIALKMDIIYSLDVLNIGCVPRYNMNAVIQRLSMMSVSLLSSFPKSDFYLSKEPAI